MNKMFVAFAIAASLAACSKKETTTPVKTPAMEQKDDATGGASYGGRKQAPESKDPKDAAPPAK
jgi:hypothetical protein